MLRKLRNRWGGVRLTTRLKVKNPNAPAATREAEEDWGR
jgi:hypothetical protein